LDSTARRPQLLKERPITSKKYELIESVLEDFGSEADWQTLRDTVGES
jgi:hypothetical protein